MVLPFDNLSPDPGDAYFSDGLTEEIITNLSYLRSLRVISRSTAMVLKGSRKDVRTIGRELNVRYVLEGSVRKVGEGLRVTAQLIDTRTDEHLWVDRLDGTMADVFAVQERIARSIVDALEVEVSPREEWRITRKPITDPHVYDTWLRAIHACHTLTAPAVDRAMRLVEGALETVGPNSLLYGTLGYLQWALYDMGIQHEEAVLDRGEEHAKKALELDPSLPQGWFAKGLIRYKRGDMGGWIRDGRRAADLGGHGEVFSFLAFSLGEVGWMEEAQRYADEGLSRDPLDFPPQFMAASVDLFVGDTGSAFRRLRKARDRFAPGEPFSGWWLCQMAAYDGREAEARAVAREVTGLDGGLFSDLCRLQEHALEGDHEGVLETLASSNLREVASTDEYFPICLANNLTLVGEEDEALDWIGRAIKWGFTNHVFLSEHDRLLVPLRDSRRFVSLMELAHRRQEEILDEVRA